jgi:hypothetical protein
MNNIITKDDLFDQTFIDLFHDFCVTNAHWEYGRKSALDRENLIWGSVLWEPGIYRNFFVEYIFKKFSETYNIKAEVLSCVLNGQTSGQDTTWHVDLYDDDLDIDNKFTLIYYVNSTWEDQSGSTVLRLDSNTQSEHKINFVPGRVLFFPSGLQHYAESPKLDNLLRITCAYKLKIIGN